MEAAWSSKTMGTYHIITVSQPRRPHNKQICSWSFIGISSVIPHHSCYLVADGHTVLHYHISSESVNPCQFQLLSKFKDGENFQGYIFKVHFEIHDNGFWFIEAVSKFSNFIMRTLVFHIYESYNQMFGDLLNN